MTIELQNDIIDAIARGTQAKLKDSQEKIFAALGDQLMEHDGEGEFSFPLGIRVKITPRGKRALVDLRLSWKVSHRADVSIEVDDANQLSFETELDAAPAADGTREIPTPAAGGAPAEEPEGGADEGLIEKALGVIRETGRASTAAIQRRLRIGYAKAARIMEVLEERGIIGPPNGHEPREILADLTAGAEGTEG